MRKASVKVYRDHRPKTKLDLASLKESAKRFLSEEKMPVAPTSARTMAWRDSPGANPTFSFPDLLRSRLPVCNL